MERVLAAVTARCGTCAERGPSSASTGCGTCARRETSASSFTSMRCPRCLCATSSNGSASATTRTASICTWTQRRSRSETVPGMTGDSASMVRLCSCGLYRLYQSLLFPLLTILIRSPCTRVYHCVALW